MLLTTWAKLFSEAKINSPCALANSEHLLGETISLTLVYRRCQPFFIGKYPLRRFGRFYYFPGPIPFFHMEVVRLNKPPCHGDKIDHSFRGVYLMKPEP